MESSWPQFLLTEAVTTTRTSSSVISNATILPKMHFRNQYELGRGVSIHDLERNPPPLSYYGHTTLHTMMRSRSGQVCPQSAVLEAYTAGHSQIHTCTQYLPACVLFCPTAHLPYPPNHGPSNIKRGKDSTPRRGGGVLALKSVLVLINTFLLFAFTT